MQKSRTAGTYPLSYLISHIDLGNAPLWMKQALIKNLPLLHVIDNPALFN